MPDPDDLAERITTRRLQRKLTQREAAELVGVSPRQFIRYERGDTTPRLEMLEKIAAAFGITAKELL